MRWLGGVSLYEDGMAQNVIVKIFDADLKVGVRD